jgi:hypothetical protein
MRRAVSGDLALERAWGTKRWIVRCFTFLIAVSEANTYCYTNKRVDASADTKSPDFITFRRTLAYQLLTRFALSGSPKACTAEAVDLIFYGGNVATAAETPSPRAEQNVSPAFWVSPTAQLVESGSSDVAGPALSSDPDASHNPVAKRRKRRQVEPVVVGGVGHVKTSLPVGAYNEVGAFGQWKVVPENPAKPGSRNKYPSYVCSAPRCKATRRSYCSCDTKPVKTIYCDQHWCEHVAQYAEFDPS